jgi:hypothetical protein
MFTPAPLFHFRTLVVEPVSQGLFKKLKNWKN